MSSQRRPRDPQRRQKIITAARQLAGEIEVGKITHRAVAEKAQVPLGSTTYYFAHIEDLLAEAVREEIAEHRTEMLRLLEASQAPDAAGKVMDLLPEDPEADALTAGSSNLYFTALARPALRPLALEWTEMFIEVLSSVIPAEKAEAVAVLIDGYGIRMTLTQTVSGPQTRARIEPQVRALLETPH